jgi:hypothetical protein
VQVGVPSSPHAADLRHELEVSDYTAAPARLHGITVGEDLRAAGLSFLRQPPPTGFLERYPGLRPSLRYFDGQDPEQWDTGTPWEGAHFEIVQKTTEILPDSDRVNSTQAALWKAALWTPAIYHS